MLVALAYWMFWGRGLDCARRGRRRLTAGEDGPPEGTEMETVAPSGVCEDLLMMEDVNL